MKRTTFLMMFFMMLTFVGCKSDKDDKARLIANEWQLKEMVTVDGNEQLPQQAPTFVLTDTNMVYGFAGCNRFFGRYSTERNMISFGLQGATRMACPDLEFEQKFLKMLNLMTTYCIEDKELRLTDQDEKQYMVFIPKEPDRDSE